MIRVVIAASCGQDVWKIADEIEKNDKYEVKDICRKKAELLDALKKKDFELLIICEDEEEFNDISAHEIMRRKKTEFDLLLISCRRDKEIIKGKLRQGVVDYLLKPYSRARFKQSLEMYICRDSVLRNIENFSQSNIDHGLLCFSKKKESFSKKGIAEKTKNIIWQCVISHDKPIETKEVMKKVGISGVSIRKYLKEMCDENLIRMIREDGKIGRPCMKYCPVKK